MDTSSQPHVKAALQDLATIAGPGQSYAGTQRPRALRGAVGQSARSSRACTHQQWCFAPASAWELSLLFWWFPWNTKPQGFFQLSVRRTGAQRKELLTSIQHEQQKHNSFPGSVGRDTHLGAAPSSEGFFFRFVSDSVSPSLLP